MTAKRRPVPVPEACADWVSRSTGSGISCVTALTGGYFSQMLRLELDEQRRALLESWTGPARTSDGTHVKLLANVADTKSAERAGPGPVEGSGLFRTELCFLNRKDEPSGGAGRPPRRGARGLRAGAHGGRADPRRRVGQVGRLRHGGGRGEPALGVRGL